MSAAEDDTELRDLLIQNLENSGVLNKLKAEMRAAVFLAMDEQDRLESKTPLVNENLRKCLNTKDGRLVASLLQDFLQVFHLDFTLAVFQPEINSLNGLEGRDAVCRELSLSQSELNRNCPLLLELVRRGRHKHSQGDTGGHVCKEPSQKQIAHARRKFDSYDKDGSGSVLRDDLNKVFIELFPTLNRAMLEAFVTDELRAADRTFSRTVDLQVFLGLYKHLFTDCRTVVLQDSDEALVPEERVVPAAVSQDVDQVTPQRKGDFQQQSSCSSGLMKERLEPEVDPDDADSFFDDPLPEPQKTYGGKVQASWARESPVGSRSETQRPAGAGGSSLSEQSHSREGASDSRERSCRDSNNDKIGSLHLDDDVEYDDDFNSHRSDLSKSEVSIGEEIEEVSIEGPDISDKVDESTQDVSVSQLSQSHGADYLEDVA